jgi:hypothetical protein
LNGWKGIVSIFFEARILSSREMFLMPMFLPIYF